jgi:hypothetical protein
MEKIRIWVPGSGMEKIWIRDKHPKSATLGKLLQDAGKDRKAAANSTTLGVVELDLDTV